MALATGVVLVAALYFARDVLIPLTLAVLLAFVLAPIVDQLRGRVGRIPAVLLAVLLAFGVLLGLGGVIGTQVANLASDIPRYATTIQEKVQSLQGVTLARLSGLVNRLARQVERASNAETERAKSGTAPGVEPASATASAASDAPNKPIPVEVYQPPQTPIEMAQRILAPLVSPLATTGIVFAVAIFILLQREDLRDRLIRLLGSRDLHRTTMAADEAAQRLSRYLLTQLALNAVFGSVIGVGMALIGVPNPVLWGVVAALMRFVPYVGAFLAASMPIALAAAVDPGWSMVAWTLALFVACEVTMGQLVEPLVYGHTTGLSPLSVVISAIFWGWLWGPIGLILSMPLTLCLVVLGRHVDQFEFLDVLLGDQPALTPGERFYHGLLAGNRDEVQDHAEQLLKDRSLAAYYDEVAIRGMQLAALDAERAVLTEDQIARIRGGVEELIGELSDHVDAILDVQAVNNASEVSSRDQPKPPTLSDPPNTELPERRAVPEVWRAPSAILCVAGRGPLDVTVSAMLAQLLEKNGLAACRS